MRTLHAHVTELLSGQPQRRDCLADDWASRSANQRRERKRMLSSLWVQATLFEEGTSRSIQGEKDLADKISQHMQVNLTYSSKSGFNRPFLLLLLSFIYATASMEARLSVAQSEKEPCRQDRPAGEAKVYVQPQIAFPLLFCLLYVRLFLLWSWGLCLVCPSLQTNRLLRAVLAPTVRAWLSTAQRLLDPLVYCPCGPTSRPVAASLPQATHISPI
jgi:hypothetical protein